MVSGCLHLQSLQRPVGDEELHRGSWEGAKSSVVDAKLKAGNETFDI